MKNVLDIYSSKNDINIKQIVAYKDNMLEIEEYKAGFKKDDTMNVMSVTKSVTSLLVGIAIDQGLIKSVDDFVMDYYKDIYTPKRGEKTIYKVTIKHLLTMTAPYKGKSEPWTKVCTSEDWTLTTLDVFEMVPLWISTLFLNDVWKYDFSDLAGRKRSTKLKRSR